MKILLFFCLPLALLSCRVGPDSNRNYDDLDPNKVYSLQLNPVSGSLYQYDISKESVIKVEVDGKKNTNESKTNVTVNYKVGKDSTGNYLFTSAYDKIRLYTKIGDNEADMDASHGTNSMDPIERMLAMLKGATILATVGPGGNILSISGYKELGDKIISNFGITDPEELKTARTQWEQVVGDQMIRQNLDQLFMVFPDSAIHLKDTWKITSRQTGDINMIVKGTNTLKAINSDIAIIGMHGKVSSDNTAVNNAAYQGATITLDGEQDGEFEMETKTGMLLHATITAKVNGTIQMMGRDIPVNINLSFSVNGRKLK